MPVTSAGLLIYRRRGERGGRALVEVLLGHPGGPFWAGKDLGAWTIPKGKLEEGEAPLAAARREFTEETGWAAPAAAPGEPGCFDLGEVRLRSGKIVRAFAAAGDFDPATLRSNLMSMEWPPRSGRRVQAPELDRAAWFDLAEAARRLNQGQAPLVERLAAALGLDPSSSAARATEGSLFPGA